MTEIDIITLAEASRRVAAAQSQQPRRDREQRVRRAAVEASRRLRTRGWSARRVARHLAIAPRTLTHWRRLPPRDLEVRLRGRPCRCASTSQRQSVLDLLESQGPHLGLPTLQAHFPEMARRELIELVRQYRSAYRRARRFSTEQLTWHQPGRVWATDHCQPPAPIDGFYEAALAVRDLASGMQLAWLPVRDETGRETRRALETLLVLHGPPLVLKTDNGSAFRSEPVQRLLRRYGVAWLPSPPRLPRYNGSCEAGIGSMEGRTFYFAARAARPGLWTSDDLQAARRQANELTRPHGPHAPTPEELWQQREPITREERQRFAACAARHHAEIVHQLVNLKEDRSEPEPNLVRRRALRRALVELRLITINRRLIPLPIRGKKTAKIS